MTALSKLYDKTLHEMRAERETTTLKEIAIGLIAGSIFIIACGWLYYVTVMAR